MFYLAQCLMERGHGVVVITHAYPGRKGLCILSNGIRVILSFQGILSSSLGTKSTA